MICDPIKKVPQNAFRWSKRVNYVFREFIKAGEKGEEEEKGVKMGCVIRAGGKSKKTDFHQIVRKK